MTLSIICKSYQYKLIYTLSSYKQLSKVILMGNTAINQATDQQIKPKGCCANVSLYISNSTIDPCDITCTICFEIYRSPRIMKCKHKICSQCITQWGRKPTITCPFCRTDLKRGKGNFGRMDKLTEKIIDKLVINCRGCQWKGSPSKYYQDFSINPTIDDNYSPCQKMQDEKMEKQQTKDECNHQKEEKTETKPNICQNPEVEMAEQVKKVQELKNLLPQSQLNINNPYGEDLFLKEYPESPISQFLSMDLFERGYERNWEDCFYLGDDEF